jgi:hypothetical protein
MNQSHRLKLHSSTINQTFHLFFEILNFLSIATLHCFYSYSPSTILINIYSPL